MTKRYLRAGIALLFGLLPLAATALPASYAITPASGKYSAARGLNNLGVFAVNNQDSKVPYRIGYLAMATTSESVGTLGGHDSVILGLNDRNEAVGLSATASGDLHAFLYSAGHLHDLTAQYGIATARAINDRGDIAGESAPEGRNGRALILHGGKVDVFGPPHSTVVDINNAGDVVGNYFSSGAGDHVFRYSQDRFSDLGTFGGTASDAAGIDDAGDIAGTRYTSDGRSHAFLRAAAGPVRDLAPLLASSTASGINNLGQVIGNLGNRAFVFDNGKLVDLNTLIDPDADVLLPSAIAINDRQQILAVACQQQVFCYGAVRLDPIPAVPEAPRAAMLLAGAALLGGRRVLTRLRGCRQNQ